ncbi:Zinc finger protein 234 Zinc finger protein 269 Zinc finger protein HZF4 [Channa argus]|uniref:Zinc finger protein 234 Zinc finger protein 269 Zinc finger protein HZF4 n=1 Tax=Channa argus TaxID=215402 RepID=A0A6G1QIC6_CHAAH|nr:Zinc finger protein 234 Zinc finger protein 269 Zinc finger protein HZF4 [Channa argus]
MFSLETVQTQISAVIETLVEAAVTELSRLLDECSANVMAAQHRSAPPGRETSERNEGMQREVTAPEERRQYNKHITNHFASLMESWTKGALEKISVMLKVSMCEAEDGPSVDRRPRLNDETTQTCPKLKARQGGAVPAHTPHVNRHQESNSGSRSVHEGLSTELTSEPAAESASDANEEDVEHTSTTTSQIIKKKTKGSFKCPSCDKRFALKCLMDRHYLTHSKPHLCSECGKRFSGLRGLVAHSRRHTGEKLYRCLDCGTEFAYKYTYERHMRQHSLKKLSTHTCTLCENQFAGVLALQRHKCCALKKTFVCSLCPETFESRQSLADHENQHSGNRDFVCEICGESFFSSSSLATHRVTHIQKETCCDVLGFGCSDVSVLKNHMSKHTGEKLFTCEVCGKGCSHQSALKHHMLTHTGERPYVCETCGKRCGHASALQNHMRIHTGKKPGQQPVCNVCGKKFRCMVNLKYHMSIHTGEKPYTCDQCGKKFSNPSNLKLHMTVHSGEKMYGCNVCGRRFTQSSSLRMHRLIHTGERPYRCLVCDKGFLHSNDLKKHQKGHLPEEAGDVQSKKLQ